jgi:hypothetical protein
MKLHLEPPMVCKANTRCILVRAERSYFQCSLLLVLLCTNVLVVGGYKLDGSQVSMCGCVQVLECVLSTLPLRDVISLCRSLWSRVPPSPFIVCKGRGRVTTFGCMKKERECPKVLPIPSFPLNSSIRIVIIRPRL